MDDALSQIGLSELAVSAVVEGCVGETIAALVAAERLRCATDPAVRSALTRIVEDEARHAELAWRTLAYALGPGDASLQQEVQSAFARAARPWLEGPGATETHASDARLLARGRLSTEAIRSVAQKALRDLILPCAGLATALTSPAPETAGAGATA